MQNAKDQGISPLVAALRAALAHVGPGQRKATAEAISALLMMAGATQEEAARALSVLGYLDGRMQLIDLYQGAFLRERMAEAMGETKPDGTLKRGTMKRIHLAYAEMWADYTGNPAYGPDEFKAAYNDWKRSTAGGGLTLSYRKGREKKPRKPLTKPD